MFNVVIDTREKKPLDFANASVDIGRAVVEKLHEGDYAIVGLKHLLRIERKAKVSELAGNITDPSYINSNLRAEFQRMMDLEIPYRFLLLEFDVEDIVSYPYGSDIPKSRWKKIRTRAPLIFKFLAEMEIDYNVRVIYAGNRENATRLATNIMKRVCQNYGR